MSIKTKFDAVAAKKYTNGDGEEKTQWINVGRAVEWNDGGIEIELNAVPVGAWWNGKIKLFVQKPKNQSAPPSRSTSSSNDDFEDSSIPF
jgi:hypothetical protein